MRQFEYDISRHPAETFTHLAYFCTAQGECSLDQVPTDQTEALRETLNRRGATGWELVQIFFGNEGIVAFWKRSIVKP